jgi:nicotinate-nucleotide adenylyltransferase
VGLTRALQKIGVFGGAFDPPHRAHIALAEAAVAQLGLDRLYVVPTGHAWHKARALTEASHRLAMSRLAFDGLAAVEVDEREIHRPGPTFTIDTLEALQAENPGAQLYLIIGADQFAAFRQWHRWADILQLAIICIAARADATGASGLFGPENTAGMPPGARLVSIELPLMPVSATQVRDLAAAGKALEASTAQLVTGPIARYISSNRLYQRGMTADRPPAD